ncbi:unnamed protein product [Rhodiola kirilowii]
MRPCEFCVSTDHKTDACPIVLVEDPTEVNTVGGYQGYNNNSNDRAGPNRQYSQATGPIWHNENHAQREIQQSTPQPAQSFYQPPHRQYNQNARQAGQYQQRGPNQYPTGQYQQKGQNQYQASPSNQQGPSKSLKDVVKELASFIHQLRVETKGDISDLKKQMSQLPTSMSALTNEPGRLPSQTIQNPKGNVNAVTLRSGRKLVGKPMEQEEDKCPRLPGEEQMRPEALGTLEQDAAKKNEDASEEEGNAPEERRPGLVPAASPVQASEEHKECSVPRTETSKISAAHPFPVPVRVPKQYVMEEDVFELFSKVEINIPLLEAIKKIPRYAKFLKELFTNRWRSTRNDQELIRE